MSFVVTWRTSGEVKGIRGYSYPTLEIWSLCPWVPVTLLSNPSYPTFTGKVILELRGPSVKKTPYALVRPVTASRGVAVLQRDIGIDSNQTSGINEIKYRRRQQVIE